MPAVRAGWLLGTLLIAGCGGGSSPVAPSPAPVVPVVTPPPVVSVITLSACPDAVTGLDVGFYRQIGCNAFDLPLQGVRHWTVAPKLYLRTVDEAGAAIDAVTLETVATAMTETATQWSAGRFALTIERGTASREGQTGWITVTWPATAQTYCGLSDVAKDGGTIALAYKTTGCDCGGSAIRPRTARHELGHAMGFWHTDNAGDLMSNPTTKPCDQHPSAREIQAVAYQYR